MDWFDSYIDHSIAKAEKLAENWMAVTSNPEFAEFVSKDGWRVATSIFGNDSDRFDLYSSAAKFCRIKSISSEAGNDLSDEYFSLSYPSGAAAIYRAAKCLIDCGVPVEKIVGSRTVTIRGCIQAFFGEVSEKSVFDRIFSMYHSGCYVGYRTFL